MWSWLKRLTASEPQVSIQVTRGVTPPDEGLSRKTDCEWDDLPSREKIKRVVVKPLPFSDGQSVSGPGKSKKRFTVQLAKQRPGTFEFDDQNPILVTVGARGRQAALDLLAERICGRDCHPEDAKITKGTCGRWNDGDIVRMEIISTEKVG